MSASASPAAAQPLNFLRSAVNPLTIILAIGFVLRLLLLPSTGFHNDVAAFESWTLSLHTNPPWEFYAKTSFADYPPGYFVVLWVLGGIYGVLTNLHVISTTDPAYFGLRLLVKLPAVVMDLVDAALIYAIVRRFARETIAVTAAACFALNPATMYVSAYWGQVDSVSWGFVLLSLWLALRSSDDPAKSVVRLTWAWIAIAFSILIKPQGALVAIVLVAFAFVPTDAAVRRRRLQGTAIGIGASLVMAFAIAALFHGSFNPVTDFAWLLQRYSYGSAVYPYNTVNAFNLYAIKQSFWQPDTAAIPIFGIELGSTWMWGIVLVLAATALIVARYLQERTDRAFLDAAMLVAFAFFILATRMHERYIYGAFLLVFPLFGFGRRNVWSAIVLSVTMLLNLVYSFAYQTTMETHPPGVDPTNLWGVGSHLIAVVNVGLFFVLGYIYLGGAIAIPGFEPGAESKAQGGASSSIARGVTAATGITTRWWFDPREGLTAMTSRDWLYASAFTIASIVMCLFWLMWPAEKIFDEIYYARAGEEYLKHLEIFEFTHPPLTKLVVTLSMLLWGGLNGWGDMAWGWRFLDVIVGAAMVFVLYLFAKRLLGSTLFAAIAAAMLTFDGFHFVQSRIATPEITVAFFSLAVLYAFYRVWTASGARLATPVDLSKRALIVYAAFLIVGGVLGALVATAAVYTGPHTRGYEFAHAAWVAAFLYVETIFYLAARWFNVRGSRTPKVASYGDGTRVLANGSFMLVDGSTFKAAPKGTTAVLDSVATQRFMPDGRLVYDTPDGSATYSPDGSIATDAGTAGGREMWTWIGILGVLSGCLAASKWNGLFDFFVVWVCVLGVVAQRAWKKPATFGNPFGMPFDVVMGTMMVVAATIYTLCYIPFFTLGHNFLDMVALQTEMYNYHAHLRGDASLCIAVVAVADSRAPDLPISITISARRQMRATRPPVASPKFWRYPILSSGGSG